MSRRLLFMVVLALSVIGLAGVAVAGTSAPSGERIVGGQNGQGGTVVEPAYDDMTGAIRYVSTPRGTPDPVKSNPVAAAPFYLPVYPVGSSVGTSVTLNCEDTTATTTENCPDHGPAVAQLAQLFEPDVYGNVGTPDMVLGHDHLMAGPGSHGDFNIAWVPILVLFTKTEYANQHLVTEQDVKAAVSSGRAIEVPLDGTPFNGVPLPNLTFHCSVVSAPVYATGVPFTG